MTFLASSVLLVCVCVVFVFANWLFMLGFFPQKASNIQATTWEDFKPIKEADISFEGKRPHYLGRFGSMGSPKYRRKVSKLILFIVDGMRSDVAANLTSLNDAREARKWGCGVVRFVAKAEAPTVTMPRIKAMMTGDIPAFVDVFANMDARHFTGDSLISQWSNSNMNITMFGDETWNRLWGHKFIRADPVTFFVNEYVEVDLNVSRHIPSELNKSDWDAMILHFGGLDHIGHLYGVFNKLASKKLEEMNSQISQIVQTMSTKSKRDWMLVVTSDHGQAEAGGHGGPTKDEVMTPVYFISPAIKSSPGKKSQIKLPDTTKIPVKQIDLTSTLAVMTGVPIPALNSGRLMVELLEATNTPRAELLELLNFNCQQLARILEQSNPKNKHGTKAVIMSMDHARELHRLWLHNYPEIDESKIVDELRLNAFDKVRHEYMMSLKEASDFIAANLTVYINMLIYISIVLLIILLLCTMSFVCTDSEDYLKANLMRHQARNSWSNYLVWSNSASHIIFISTFLGSFSAFVLCITHAGVAVPTSTYLFYSAAILTSLCLSFILFCTTRVVLIAFPRRFPMSLLIMFLHGVLMTSSSFIEEEHQIIYFLVTTVVLLVVFKRLRDNCRLMMEKKHVTFGVAYNGNNEGSGGRRSLNNPESASIHTQKVLLKDFAYGVFVLLMIRHIRSWNQTGDKWLSYPDLGDWLLNDENKQWLLILYLAASVLAFMVILSKNGIISAMICSLALFYVVCYHASAYKIYWLHQYVAKDDHGMSYASYLRWYLVYFLSLTFIMRAVKIFIKDFFKCDWKLEIFNLCDILQSFCFTYCLLVQTPQDFIVTVLLACLSIPMHSILENVRGMEDSDFLFLNNLLARFAYFALGNSNSFTTVDIQTAYTGLSDHNLPVVALNLFVIMFTGPVIWYSQALPTVFRRSRIKFSLGSILHILLFRIVTCTSVLSICWLLRFHIMTWTVFSPKVIFEVGWSLMDIVLALTLCFVNVCRSENL